MAGFDFFVQTTAQRRALMRNLLFFSQRLGTERGCVIRFRWTKTSSYYVTVDGSLPNLQSLGHILLENLISFSEGHCAPPARTERADVAKRVFKAYLEGLIPLGDGLQEIVNLLHKSQIDAVPYSFTFDIGNATHLKGKIRNLTSSLLSYREGRI